MKQNIRPYIIYKVYALLLAALLCGATAHAQGAGRITRRGTTCRPVGQDMVLKTTLVLDSLRLKSNHQLVVTPVLEGPDGQVATFRPVMVNGRRQHIWYQRNGSRRYAGATELKRLKGKGKHQSLSYLDSLPYEAWMDRATLRFATDTCGCGDLLASNPGDTRILNSHPETGICMAFLQPEAGPDPIITVSGKAYLDYRVNKTDLDPNYRRNPEELDKIIETINKVRRDSNVTITHIGIHGYASPEGSWENNIRLSIGRAATLKNYVRQLMHFDESVFSVHNTPEDWGGLDSLLVASNLENKEAILAVVRDSTLQPDPRNEKIKATWPEQYKFILDTWYPALRHSDYTVQYKIRAMSDRQAATLLHTRPQLLSLNKMFRIANLYTPGSDEFNEVFDIAVRLHPANATANLNAACIALNQRDLDRAEAYLTKAGDSPQAIHARGVLALLQGHLSDAEFLLNAAKQAGVPEADTNLSILDQMRHQSLD